MPKKIRNKEIVLKVCASVDDGYCVYDSLEEAVNNWEKGDTYYYATEVSAKDIATAKKHRVRWKLQKAVDEAMEALQNFDDGKSTKKKKDKYHPLDAGASVIGHVIYSDHVKFQTQNARRGDKKGHKIDIILDKRPNSRTYGSFYVGSNYSKDDQMGNEQYAINDRRSPMVKFLRQYMRKNHIE